MAVGLSGGGVPDLVAGTRIVLGVASGDRWGRIDGMSEPTTAVSGLTAAEAPRRLATSRQTALGSERPPSYRASAAQAVAPARARRSG